MEVHSENKPSLKQWLEQEQSYTRPALKKEIIQILESVVNNTETIKLTIPLIYSVTCDGR